MRSPLGRDYVGDADFAAVSEFLVETYTRHGWLYGFTGVFDYIRLDAPATG